GWAGGAGWAGWENHGGFLPAYPASPALPALLSLVVSVVTGHVPSRQGAGGRLGMKRSGTIVRLLAACVGVVLCVAGTRAADAPKRINRAIELLAQGQPIYYTGSHEGTDGNFEQGV